MFVPLHVKSEYSPGLGTSPVYDLLCRASASGCSALGLTDVENLYGQVRFHYESRRTGVRPVTGVELRAGYGRSSAGNRRGRLILLARDRDGYESLCRVVSRRRNSAARFTP